MVDVHRGTDLPFSMIKALYDIRRKIDDLYQLEKISDSSDVVAFLERVLAIAIEEINTDDIPKIERGLILIPEGDSAQESYEIVARFLMTDTDMEFSSTIVRDAIRSGETVFCSNAREDPRFQDVKSIRHLQVVGCICVPIRLDTRVVGALYIDNRTVVGALTDVDQLFLEELAIALARPIDTVKFYLNRMATLQQQLESRYGMINMIGQSPHIRQVFELIRVAAGVTSTVLITGETGTGKELAARAIHNLSDRKVMPFVVVDCSALPDSLLEDELFGHKKGAFTGAHRDRKGAFEEAHRGTLLLDEVADASPALQLKLRRALQEGEVKRLGENTPRKVDVRIICATNRDLTQLMKDGEFREDLYYRINVINVQMPPLRDRTGDIPLLAEHFRQEVAQNMGRKPPTFTEKAMEALCRYRWPGNVRELRNTVEQAMTLCTGNRIDVCNLSSTIREESPSHLDHPSGDSPIKQTERRSLSEMKEGTQKFEQEDEKELILSTLASTHWNRTKAANALGISRVTLYKKIKKYGLKES